MQKDFNKGVEHYLAGRFTSAERAFRKVIKRQPKHGDALHLLGLIAVQTGGAKAGERRIRQAIAAAPQSHIYHGSLGAALRNQGRLEDALQAYGDALALRDDYAVAWQNIGQIESDLGRFDKAIAAFRKAIDLDGDNAPAHFGLAFVYGQQGELPSAERCYQAALKLDPDNIEAWSNLGNILAEAGRFSLAEAAFGEAIRRRPDDPALPLNMAKRLEAGGRMDGAAKAYAEALHRDPKNSAALAGLASLTAHLGDDKEAGELFSELARLDPQNPRTHAAIAVWHESASRLAEARLAAAAALALDPAHLDASLLLAQLDRRAGDLTAARDRLDGLVDDEDDGTIAFELGRVLDRLDEPALAYQAFERGNAAFDQARNKGRFDGRGYAKMVADIGTSITANQVASWPKFTFDDGLADPIFFVGFPRSGTTLMEQMLDAHDGLISLEEQPLLEAARTSLVKTATADYPEYLHKDLSLADISQARQVYWDSAAIALGVALGKELGEALGEKLGQRRLLDKLPLNIVHLPLIRRIFPDAPVLVALRDPRDVVLSCFMQSFEPNEAMVHFRDVVSAANLYAGVMSNWLTQRDLFGPHIFEYKYEDLVADPETIMRAVFGFLGLPWQQTVLDYHARRRNRLVATPSYQDVSEKIYDRAIARWQTYTEPLEPVLEPLAPFVKAFGYEPGGYSGKPALRSPSA